MAGSVVHAFILLITLCVLHSKASAYLAQSRKERNDTISTEVDNVLAAKDDPGKEAPIGTETTTATAAIALTTMATTTHSPAIPEAVIQTTTGEIIRATTLKDECDDLPIVHCMLVNCTWIKGKCSIPKAPDQINPWVASTEPKTYADILSILERMWQHPPTEAHTVIWQAFVGSTVAFVLFIAICGCFYCTWRCCLRSWRPFQKTLLMSSSTNSSIFGKRLILVLPQGREIPADEYIIDFTGTKPRAVLVPRSGTNYMREPSVVGDSLPDPVATSSSSSLGNIMDGSMPRAAHRLPSDDAKNFHGGGYSNEAFTLSDSDSLGCDMTMAKPAGYEDEESNSLRDYEVATENESMGNTSENANISMDYIPEKPWDEPSDEDAEQETAM